MKLKSVLLSGLSLVLVAAISIGGTVAYLTSEDSDVNVMTVGNVTIEQIEQERDENDNLVDFSQAKPAYPAVGKIAWDDSFLNVNGIGYKVFDDGLKNVVDKIVTVNNTGKFDAYVRTIVAIEAPEGDPNDLIHFNWNDTGVELEGGFVTKIDGVDYYIVSFVYTDALAAGAKSAPSLMQVFLDSKTTNEDCAKFGPSWEILVKTQAVQAEGFADAKTALDTAFGTVTAAAHPWSNTVLVEANNEAELLDALVSGAEVIVLTDIVEVNKTEFNGNGSEVILAGVGDGSYGYLAFAPGAGVDVKVENIAVTGSGFVEIGHTGVLGGNYTVNNVTVKDMTATLCVVEGGNPISAAFSAYNLDDPANKHSRVAYLNDCVMTGTVSVDPAYKAYDAAFTNRTTTVIDGGEYGSIYLAAQAYVTVKNAEIDTIDSCAISTSKLGKLTIGAGAKVGTINLTPTGNYPFALTIEDGATVGKIIYKGVTYTQADWLAR